ncbi:MAG: hypothetical protein AAF380_00650 [Bacteroidota bacterium]
MQANEAIFNSKIQAIQEATRKGIQTQDEATQQRIKDIQKSVQYFKKRQAEIDAYYQEEMKKLAESQKADEQKLYAKQQAKQRELQERRQKIEAQEAAIAQLRNPNNTGAHTPDENLNTLSAQPNLAAPSSKNNQAQNAPPHTPPTHHEQDAQNTTPIAGNEASNHQAQKAEEPNYAPVMIPLTGIVALGIAYGLYKPTTPPKNLPKKSK